MGSADTDSARQWVEAAQRVPLLTPAEELHLAALVQAWQRHPGGPDNAPPAVRRRGLRARNRIVSANLRLVAKFVQSRQHSGPLVDRFQNGSLGLVRAAELFDPERGYRFSTFAYWWLRAEIGRGEFSEPLIKLPSNVFAALRGQRDGDCPAHLLADGRAASFVRSLDFVVPGCDSELTLGDTLAAPAPDASDPDADELAMRMAALDPLELRMIEGRWGLRVDPATGLRVNPVPLRALAAQEAKSMGEVKQTLANAMCKLRKGGKWTIPVRLYVLPDGTIVNRCGRWFGQAATQQQAELYCDRTGWQFDVIAEDAISIYGRPGKRRRRCPQGGRSSANS